MPLTPTLNTETTQPMQSDIVITEITDSVRAKGENTTLLKFTAEGVVPVYAAKIQATYLLMEWPLQGSDQEVLRCYGFLLPHGKVHAVEVFFLRQQQKESFVGEYLGTTKVFSVQFFENKYQESFDEKLSELVWSKVCGYVVN